MVARTVTIGIIASMIVGIALGMPYSVSEQDTLNTKSFDLVFAEKDFTFTYDVFDNPPTFFGDDMIISSPGKSVDGIVNAGSISVIDADTNSLLYTINNPDPTENDLFGQNIATSNSYIIVGVQEKTPIYGNYLSAKIYIFDGKTGSLLHAINNPDEAKSDIKFHSTFGRSIGTMGDNVISGAYFEKSGYAFPTHLMHVFDGKTGTLLYTLDSPIPGSVSFGETFESFDGKIEVYTRDADPNDKKMMMSSMSLTEIQVHCYTQ